MLGVGTMKFPRAGRYLPTLCRESEPLSLMAQKDMRQEEAVLAAYQGCSARPHLSCIPISPDQLLGFSCPSKLSSACSLPGFPLTHAPVSSPGSLLYAQSSLAARAPLSRRPSLTRIRQSRFPRCRAMSHLGYGQGMLTCE